MYTTPCQRVIYLPFEVPLNEFMGTIETIIHHLIHHVNCTFLYSALESMAAASDTSGCQGGYPSHCHIMIIGIDLHTIYILHTIYTYIVDRTYNVYAIHTTCIHPKH